MDIDTLPSAKWIEAKTEMESAEGSLMMKSMKDSTRTTKSMDLQGLYSTTETIT